jgi:hypothetical protein
MPKHTQIANGVYRKQRRHVEHVARLKPGGDAASHAGYIVVELCGSAQVVNNKLFQQPAAKPFLSWWRNRGPSVFFPSQVQHSFLHSPLHSHTAFGA